MLANIENIFSPLGKFNSVAPLGLILCFNCFPGADAARLQTSALLGLYEVKSFFISQPVAAVPHSISCTVGADGSYFVSRLGVG